MIIKRQEEKLLKKINKWTLVYGRRKTGKTFLIRNFIDYDEYFFVKRDKTIIVESTGNTINYETFIELFTRLINDGKSVVVDEFHRLGSDFLDYLHYTSKRTSKRGRLLLVSSTFHLANELIGVKSPLLGLLAEFHLGLIKIEDVIKSLPKNTGRKDLVELSILMSEPILIDYYKSGMKADELRRIFLLTAKYAIPALVGEIFIEEERNLSDIYTGILHAIASGKRSSTEISSYLFSRKLTQKDNPGSVQQYLKNMSEIGLLKRVKVANRKTYLYEHISPIIELFYYCDEKYNISEDNISEDAASQIANLVFPLIVEKSIRSFLARKFGLIENILIEKDFEIDGYLTRYRHCEIALEVKWKNTIDLADIKRAEEVLSKVEAKQRLLFVPDKRKVKYHSNIVKIVDITDFV